MTSELEFYGWQFVSNISSRDDLIKLAQSLGRPRPSLTGSIVKELRPVAKHAAQRLTLSATYGLGTFPLHTDTAFWPVPARYVVLRVHGDLRRSTTVRTFQNC